jgi:tripartite ATP-independent transporter DctM subunit
VEVGLVNAELTIAPPGYGSNALDRLSRTLEANVLRWVDLALTVIVASTLIGEVCVMFGNAMSRGFAGGALTWASEVGTLSLTILIFGGAALAYHRDETITVTALVNVLPAWIRPYVGAVAEMTVLIVSIMLGLLALKLMPFASVTKSVVLRIPDSWPTGVMVGGMFTIALFAVVRLLRYRLAATGTALVIVGALVVLGVKLPSLVELTTDQGIVVIALGFLILLAIGVPIGFIFAAAALTYNQELGHLIPSSTIPYNILTGGNSLLLLAVPLFIASGAIMTAGGLMTPVADFVILLVGRIRGGLLQVVVVSLYIMSGVSGSKIADVAAVGAATETMFERSQHSRGERAAVLAASAAMGETVPPSIGLLVLGSITTLSIGSLFLAGILPAAAVAVVLMAFIYLRARRQGQEPIRVSTTPLGAVKIGLGALPTLLVPVILVSGIVGGLATPTDASSFAVVYAVLLCAVYRSVGPRQLGRIFADASRLTGMLLFIIATAQAFSQMLTVAQIPQRLATGLQSVAHDRWSFLLISIVLLIVMGMALEGLPAILIFAPLLVPLAPSYGVDPLQYGIVLLLALGIGSFSPPIGIGLYACCSITKTTLESAVRPVIPYMAVVFLGLLLVAAFPFLSLFLAHRLLG